MRGKTTKLLQSDIVGQAVKDAFLKLDPRVQWRNLVMFVVEIGAFSTLLIALGDVLTGGNFKFDIQISIWLWFTVLFANFSEALAEGRGKAQAESLRSARSEAMANRLLHDGSIEQIPALDLRKGDLFVVDNGEIIPGDGEITEGTALVDESAVTGESAPVVREPGSTLRGVTGG
ncbi:MAG: potassium-transporting ATPase subunit B, partial [Methanotrichaceae archaeon]